MGTFPRWGGSGGRTETIGITPASTALTSVTCGAREYGTAVELSAATTFQYDGVIVYMGNPSTAGITFNLVIGSGLDKTVASNIYACSPTTRQQLTCLHLPIQIPAGVRIGIAASRDAGTTGTAEFALTGYSGGFLTNPPFQRATGLGPTAGAPTGIYVQAGGSAHTKGATYTAIVASTAEPYRALQVLAAGAEASTAYQFLDIAVGAVSSEAIVLPDLVLRSHANTLDQQVQGMMFPVQIPASTRIAARIQSTNASDYTRVALVGYA